MRVAPILSPFSPCGVSSPSPPPAGPTRRSAPSEAELTGADASRFAVENLLGTMRISVGTGSAVRSSATVYGETAELADAVRLERIGRAGGAATLRVRYPYDKVSTFRYREPSDRGTTSVRLVGSSSDYDYDGHRVRVSRGRGKSAPRRPRHPRARRRRSTRASRNLAGLRRGRRAEGQDRVPACRAPTCVCAASTARSTLDGSSGDVRARDIKGSWKSDFSSGDSDLDGFEGESLSFQTTSGDLVLRSVSAKRRSSRPARATCACGRRPRGVLGPSDLGRRGLRSGGHRLQTRSGSRPRAATCRCGFPPTRRSTSTQTSRAATWTCASPTERRFGHRDTIVGYRRGTGGARIQVRTSSGDLSSLSRLASRGDSRASRFCGFALYLFRPL